MSVAGAGGATLPPVALSLFVHPAHGGGWSARSIPVDLAGAASPSIASGHGELAIAQLASGGDVLVSTGTLTGAFTTTNLSTGPGAPLAEGGPSVYVSARGAIEVWYRSTTGDLEVVSRLAAGAPWRPTDVSTVTGGLPIGGDPTLLGTPTSVVGFAVTDTGTVATFSDYAGTPTGWVEGDPTGGAVFPPLEGTLDVLRAPGDPAATVIVGTTSSGDVVELSDEDLGPPVGVGDWSASDLTALAGVPAVSGALPPSSPLAPAVAYLSAYGDVVALSLSSGLPGGAVAKDLSATSEAYGAQGSEPSVVEGPAGAAVAVRSPTDDLLLASVADPPAVADVSFQPHTAVLVASDVRSTVDGGADVLVAADGGAIAPTPLLRRIVLLASSFDQQHAGFQTTPAGSDCNPFTATFGRGSTGGCPPGDAAEAWCSDFSEWIWQTSGVPTRTIDGWAASFITWGRLHHRVQMGAHATPAVGDAIVWGQRKPMYGQHVAIIVSVVGSDVEIVSGNSGGDFPGYGVGVWRTGLFDAATSTINGYPVLGIVRP